MKKGYTQIAIIMDRSGSMNVIKDDMQGGLWSLIVEQHKMPGVCRVNLYRFDHIWEPMFDKLSGDIQQVDCTLVPRGNTALYDSVVKSLSDLEAKVFAMPEEERPEFVFVVVITDGADNASRENTRAASNAAVERVIEKYGWKFTYLGAGPDAFEEGHQMRSSVKGVQMKGFMPTQGGTRRAYASYSAGIGAVRSGKAKDVEMPPDDEK